MKIKMWSMVLIGMAVCLALSSSVSAEEATEAVAGVWRALPVAHEEGLLGERVDSWRQGRLWHMLDAEDDYLLSGFESRPGVHPWQGEHVGKWLHAATLAYEQTHDEKLLKALRKVVERLLAAQEPNGYLGTYGDDYTFMALPENTSVLAIVDDVAPLKNQETAKKPAGKPRGGWDTWTFRYNIYGLLTYERFHPDPRVVEACRKMADLLIGVYGEGGADLTQYGTRQGISATTLLESIVMLYERTGDQKYLDFAEHIVVLSEGNPKLRLVGNMLENGSVVYSGDGKAYQLMANLLGYLGLYKNTGDERYMKTVRNAWDNILAHHIDATGGPWGRKMSYNGNRECFALPRDYDPANVHIETCSTTTWIQLNLHLLELTGQAKYAAEAERTVFNALLAAQHEEGVDWCYYFRTNQDRRPYETAIKCCASSGPRALEMFSHYLIGEVDGGISLTSLVPGSAVLPEAFGGATIRVTGDYPVSPNAQIRFEEAAGKEFSIEFREPANSRLTSARINGQEIALSKNDRGYYPISRAWKTADAIALEFEYLLKSHVATPEGAQNWVAFTYGPWALAETTVPGDLLDDPFAGKEIPAGPASEWLEPDAIEAGAAPTFRIKNTEIVLGLFYSAGSRESGPRTYFKTGQTLPEAKKPTRGQLVDLTQAVARFAPGWTARDCGGSMNPGLRANWGGRENVLITHPLSRERPCVLSRSLEIPSAGTTSLVLDVAHNSPRHDWTLVVRADGKPLLLRDVSSKTAEDLWRTVRVDLSSLAGKTALLELENHASNWAFEAGFWSRIAVEHESNSQSAGKKNP